MYYADVIIDEIKISEKNDRNIDTEIFQTEIFL